jgi:SH3 domain protein
MIKKLLLTALFITSVSFATETPKYGYVTDSVDIPIRHNPMIEKSNLYFKIPSGEQLEIIEVGDGWTKVKYGTTEGWMLSRYITNDITSHQKLKQLKNENKLLAKTNKRLINRNQILEGIEAYTLKLYGEDMKEHRRKDKEFNLLVKKTSKLQKKLEKEYSKLGLKKDIFLEQKMDFEIAQEDFLNKMKVYYINRIAQKVKEQWRYQGAKDSWGCDVHILQDVDGNVQSVNLKSCNVDDSKAAKSFKNSIERAVYKASPLPPAPDKSVFDREILFHFKIN